MNLLLMKNNPPLIINQINVKPNKDSFIPDPSKLKNLYNLKRNPVKMNKPLNLIIEKQEKLVQKQNQKKTFNDQVVPNKSSNNRCEYKWSDSKINKSSIFKTLKNFKSSSKKINPISSRKSFKNKFKKSIPTQFIKSSMTSRNNSLDKAINFKPIRKCQSKNKSVSKKNQTNFKKKTDNNPKIIFFHKRSNTECLTRDDIFNIQEYQKQPTQEYPSKDIFSTVIKELDKKIQKNKNIQFIYKK